MVPTQHITIEKEVFLPAYAVVGRISRKDK